MKEAEWKDCKDISRIVSFLSKQFSERKLRLVACAYSVPFWPYIVDPRTKVALEAAEKYADRIISINDLRNASESARQAEADVRGREYEWRQWNIAHLAAMISGSVGEVEAVVAGDASIRPWIYDLYGNPFRHINTRREWFTSDVVALAKRIYSDREFDRLPILADALQDAGCDNEDILNHCRGDGSHVRGCWVVDLILGKQ